MLIISFPSEGCVRPGPRSMPGLSGEIRAQSPDKVKRLFVFLPAVPRLGSRSREHTAIKLRPGNPSQRNCQGMRRGNIWRSALCGGGGGAGNKVLVVLKTAIQFHVLTSCCQEKWGWRLCGGSCVVVVVDVVVGDNVMSVLKIHLLSVGIHGLRRGEVALHETVPIAHHNRKEMRWRKGPVEFVAVVVVNYIVSSFPRRFIHYVIIHSPPGRGMELHNSFRNPTGRRWGEENAWWRGLLSYNVVRALIIWSFLTIFIC